MIQVAPGWVVNVVEYTVHGVVPETVARVVVAPPDSIAITFAPPLTASLRTAAESV